MATPLEPFYQLKCGCNSYDWGQKGSKSLAARLCAQTPGFSGETDPSKPFSIDDSKPYAEMWMGTYPSLPSYILSTSEPLQDVLDRYHKDLLGPEVVRRFSTPPDSQGLVEPIDGSDPGPAASGSVRLPFLPKILSIAGALPLQIHPDKDSARDLHARDPKSFTDPNHKPEIAVALSDFESFCGFKPLASIAALLKLEPLRKFRSASHSSSSKFTNEDLRALVKALLDADADTISKIFDALSKLPQSTFSCDEHNAPMPDLLPRLIEQRHTADDPGPLVALITMNYVRLKPGEALYIPADGIHAYLSGDIVECMASSDNTIATGFCPPADRFSTDDFCSLLTFQPHSVEECILQSMAYWRSEKGHTKAFQPPLSEFNLLQTTLEAGEEEVLGKEGPAILISTRGDATVHAEGKSFELGEGHVYFVAQGTRLSIEAGEKGLLMYTAYVEV